MPHRKTLIILNPVAGHGKTLTVRAAVESKLRGAGLAFETVVTERIGHARELAWKACRDGFDIIASMGGDGTLSEVVDGIYSRGGGEIPSGVSVAIIPSGTGNDFLGGSGISTNWSDAVDALINPRVRSVDIMEVSDSAGFHRCAANSFGVGFDAYVTGNVSKRGSGKVGPLGYMVEALRGIVAFNPAQAMIAIGAKPLEVIQRMWLFAATNSERFGGGMRVNPGAKIDDGLINLAILHGVSRLTLASRVFQVRSGKHVGKAGVRLDTATEVSLTAPKGFPCHVDGDTVEVTYPVTIKVLPGALPLVVRA